MGGVNEYEVLQLELMLYAFDLLRVIEDFIVVLVGNYRKESFRFYLFESINECDISKVWRTTAPRSA